MWCECIGVSVSLLLIYLANSVYAGVTSFSIDMETKKVTIIGNVTPLGVLASVSKVKNAQLWPSQTLSSR